MRFAFVLVLLVSCLPQAVASTQRRWIEVTVAADVPSWFVVYADTGVGFREEDSSRVPYPASSDSGVRLRLELPDGPLRALRIDPALGAATVRLADWKLCVGHRLSIGLAPGGVTALQQVELLGWEGSTLVLRVPPGADDPMLLVVDSAWLAVLGRGGRSRGAVVFGMAALASAFTVVLVGAGRRALRVERSGFTVWGTFAGVALLAWGLKLGLAQGGQRGLSPLPFWDAWDGEIAEIAAPLASGTLDPAAWFRPHNEHRIVPTRLLAGLVTAVDGAWDNRATVAVSLLWLGLALAALVAVPLAYGDRLAAAACLTVILAFACGATDWENVGWGLQGQVHASLLFSVLALAVVARGRADFVASGWAVGALLAAMLSMGAGLPAALAAVLGAVLAGRAASEGTRFRVTWAHTLLAASLLAAAGVGVLLMTHVPGHDSLKAHGIGDILRALVHYGAWPLPAHPLALVALWLPSAGLLVYALLRGEPRASHRFLSMLAAYGFGLAVALAVSRAGSLPHIASRYTTLLVVGLIANAGCAACILRLLLPHAEYRTWRVGLTLALAGACAAFVVYRSEWQGRPAAEGFTAAAARRSEVLVRHAQEPAAGILRAAAPADLVYPVPARLEALTADPAVVAVLPAAYRRATGLYPQAEDGIVALVAEQILRYHVVLVVLGAAILGWSAARLMPLCASEVEDDPAA